MFVSFQRTKTLKSESKPNPDWFLQSPQLLGTHYVRSITYGGELIASIRYKVKNSEDKERIAATIDASFKTAGGTIGIDLKGMGVTGIDVLSGVQFTPL